MIEVKRIPDTNIVEMFMEDKASSEEFEVAMQTLEDVISECGSVKVLDIVGDIDMPPIPWSKFWEDIKFGFKHLSDITHIAVVADQSWIATWVKGIDPLIKAEMKMFERTDTKQAMEWLGHRPQ